MKNIAPIASAALIFAAQPQLAQAQDLQSYIIGFIALTDDILIPFLLGMAFLFFVINVIRYFVIEGGNKDAKEKARALAIYGVAAFVLIIVFWGLVNMLATSLGLSGCEQPSSDYYLQHFVGPNLPNC